MPGVIHKRIFEWREIVRAIRRAQQVPREPRSEFERKALEALRSQTGGGRKPIGRLAKRLFAIPGNRRVELWYVNGAARASQLGVAFQGAGGSTAYHVSGDRPAGHAVNKHTVFSAAETRLRSFRRDRERWFYGRDGVWQRGYSPIYRSAGIAGFWPTMALRDALHTLQNGEWAPRYDQWRESAARFLKRVHRTIRPFGDIIVRYRISGDLEEIHWHKRLDNDKWYRGEVGVRCMAIAELHAPIEAGEKSYWLQLGCFGEMPFMDQSRPANYAVYPTDPTQNQDDQSPVAQWCITPRASRALAAAAEWAASKVRIPC